MQVLIIAVANCLYVLNNQIIINVNNISNKNKQVN